MDAIARFGQYADAFEKVFESDDWPRLEPYFAEDAVYEIEAPPPFGGTHRGREAVFAALKQSLDSFDRRFDARELELLEGPALRDGQVWIRWRVTYRLRGAPDLAMEGEETVRFEGDRISRLVDRFTQATTPSVLAYLQEHGSKLTPGAT